MIYRWKPEARLSIDAQAAGEEMERIRVHHNGRLESKMLVDAGRSKDSPLHNAFEWNDKTAAHGYRIEQAKHLIRNIVVTVDKPSGGTTAIRAFVSVVREEDRSYTSTAHALSDADLRQQVVHQAWRELEAWHHRYAELAEFAELFAMIEARAAK